jgi:hypothetical protein
LIPSGSTVRRRLALRLRKRIRCDKRGCVRLIKASLKARKEVSPDFLGKRGTSRGFTITGN